MSNAELKAANAVLSTTNAELVAKIAELEAKVAATPAKSVSKSRQQAEACLALLNAGTVTVAQLAEINPKYPADPIYFVRTLLKVNVSTHRAKGGKTTYTLAPKPQAAALAELPVPSATPDAIAAPEVPAAVIEAAVVEAATTEAAQ